MKHKELIEKNVNTLLRDTDFLAQVMAYFIDALEQNEQDIQLLKNEMKKLKSRR